MVELSTRKREIGGYGGNYPEKLGRKRIMCATQFTMPDSAGTSLYPAGTNTGTRSSKLNQANRSPDFSGSLISSISFSSSSPISFFLSTTRPSLQEQKVTTSLCISRWHHHELTPSVAYAECRIRLVLHTPKIVCRPFILTISS
jgi:hypothetical protein